MKKILQKLKKHIAIARKATSCTVAGNQVLILIKEGPPNGREKQYYCYTLEQDTRWLTLRNAEPEAQADFRFGLSLREAKHIALTKAMRIEEIGEAFIHPPTLFSLNSSAFPDDLREELNDLLQSLWELSVAKSLDLTHKMVS